MDGGLQCDARKVGSGFRCTVLRYIGKGEIRGEGVRERYLKYFIAAFRRARGTDRDDFGDGLGNRSRGLDAGKACRRVINVKTALDGESLRTRIDDVVAADVYRKRGGRLALGNGDEDERVCPKISVGTRALCRAIDRLQLKGEVLRIVGIREFEGEGCLRDAGGRLEVTETSAIASGKVRIVVNRYFRLLLACRIYPRNARFLSDYYQNWLSA